jgi:hypothetical protein
MPRNLLGTWKCNISSMCPSFGSFPVVSRQPNGVVCCFFLLLFPNEIEVGYHNLYPFLFLSIGHVWKIENFHVVFCIERRHHGAPVGVVNGFSLNHVPSES